MPVVTREGLAFRLRYSAREHCQDCQYIILPNAAWEHHLPQIQRLLPSIAVLPETVQCL